MKFYFFILSIVFSTILFGQKSLNVELLDNWMDNSIITNSSENRFNDCWGYEMNGIEYAFIGSTEGTHIFQITPDNKLEEIDFIQGGFSSTSVVHRDLKTYDHYLYSVCDEGGGMQIIDLNYLPDSAVLVSTNDSTFSRIHNLYFDSENELMYVCSVTPKQSGILQGLIPMQVYSVSDPVNPQLIYTGPNNVSEVHDAYVRDNIAYLNCGFDGLRVYDFTAPTAPLFLQNLNIYQDQGYNHQGWLSPDGKTFIFADETKGKKIKKCNVSEDHTLSVNSSFGTNSIGNSAPHNIMLSNNFAFVAYYNEGLRIYDIRFFQPKEIGFYDTFEEESLNKFKGAWGVYSNFNSGKIIVSDRNSGLFLFDFDQSVFSTNNDIVSIYPNPVLKGEGLTVKLNDPSINYIEISILDLKGREILNESFNLQNYGVINPDLSRGFYILKVSYTDYLGDTIIITRRITQS